MELKKGTIVIAKVDDRIQTYKKTEAGVCYDVYEVDGEPRYAVIFEKLGTNDSFGPEDLSTSPDYDGKPLLITNGFDPQTAEYEFTTIADLSEAYHKGYFDNAFFGGDRGTGVSYGSSPKLN